MKYLCCLVLSLFSLVPVLQAREPEVIPHTVRVLIRNEAIAKLRPLFARQRATIGDIQQIALSDNDDIASLLGFSSLHIIRFAPFAAQHSAVFEDVRERINPQLFSDRLIATRGDDLLQTSEDRLSRWFTLEYSDSIAPERVVFMSKASDMIELAEPVYARFTQSTPPAAGLNDPLLDSQYYLRMTHTIDAWAIQQCDSTMLVATIDQGIEFNHPDLGEAVWHNPGEMGTDAQGNDKSSNHIDDDGDGFVDDTAGWDFSGANGNSQRSSPTAESMHGHHVAGVLAATGNNGIGIAGVAHGARLMVLKAQSNFSCSDRITTGYEGIIYAADHAAKVISCSWGGPGRSESEQDVISYAFAKHSIVVCSAGNDGSTYFSNFPSSYTHTVSVGSVDANDTITLSSSPSWHVTVCAPGSAILSTLYPDSIGLCYPLFVELCGDEPMYDTAGYGKMCGTSMATPQVAGALALVWQHFPTLTNEQVIARLRSTCRTISGDHLRGFNGRGLIDVYSALTKPNVQSVKIEKADFRSTHGHSWIGAHDTGTLTITLHNLLDRVTPLISVELVTENGDTARHFSFIGQFPVIAMAADTHVVLPPLTIISDGTTPERTNLLVRLRFYDYNASYDRDYDYAVIPVRTAYHTLHNNLTISLADNGALGFRDAILDQEGDGLYWDNAPSSIRVNAKSVLLGGGLIIARDTDHVVDALGGFSAYPSSTALAARSAMTFDSGTQTLGAYTGPGSHAATSLWDYQADDATKLNISLAAHVYTLDSLAPNAAFVSYVLPHSAPFDAGIAMDWDFADYGNRDTAWFDQSDSIMYATRNRESGYPVAAMKLVSPVPSGSSLTYYVLSGSSFDSGYGPASFGAKVDKWHLFQVNKAKGVPGDMGVLLGIRNMQTPDTSNALSYVLALGESAAMARYNLKCAVSAVAGTPMPELPARVVRASQTNVRLWPNPTSNGLHIEAGAPVRARLTDMLGREVLRSEGSDLDLTPLATGVYDIEITTGGAEIHRRIVRE